jgi:hypothetical protein
MILLLLFFYKVMNAFFPPKVGNQLFRNPGMQSYRLQIMQELRSGLGTQTKIQVIRFIESGIGMPSVANTIGLSLDQVKKIKYGTYADIKAVMIFLEEYYLQVPI